MEHKYQIIHDKLDQLFEEFIDKNILLFGALDCGSLINVHDNHKDGNDTVRLDGMDNPIMELKFGVKYIGIGCINNSRKMIAFLDEAFGLLFKFGI